MSADSSMKPLNALCETETKEERKQTILEKRNRSRLIQKPEHNCSESDLEKFLDEQLGEYQSMDMNKCMDDLIDVYDKRDDYQRNYNKLTVE